MRMAFVTMGAAYAMGYTSVFVLICVSPTDISWETGKQLVHDYELFSLVTFPVSIVNEFQYGSVMA
jgi:hypothetical protein